LGKIGGKNHYFVIPMRSTVSVRLVTSFYSRSVAQRNRHPSVINKTTTHPRASCKVFFPGVLTCEYIFFSIVRYTFPEEGGAWLLFWYTMFRWIVGLASPYDSLKHGIFINAASCCWRTDIKWGMRSRRKPCHLRLAGREFMHRRLGSSKWL
jgi:hypothetical protein